VFNVLLFVCLLTAAAVVVVAESQPTRVRPFKTMAREAIYKSGNVFPVA